MTTTYNELKQKFNIFEINEEIINLFKTKDIFQVILDAINNKDEINALFLINNEDRILSIIDNSTGFDLVFESERLITEDMKFEIGKIAALNQLKSVYRACFNGLDFTFKEKLYENIKDCNDEDVFIFLYKEGLFTDKLENVPYSFKSKKLHRLMKNEKTNYDVNVRREINKNIKGGNYDNVLFFVKIKHKLNLYCEDFFRLNRTGEIKDLYSRRMFVNDLDKMLYYSIVYNHEDLINFFIEKGANLENIKGDIDAGLLDACPRDNLSKVENLLKYKANVNKIDRNGKDCIDLMNTSSSYVVKRYLNEISVLLLKNSDEQYLILNFIRLLHYLKLQDINEMYNEGFRLNPLNKISSNERFFLDVQKLSLLNNLDDNFIDFVNNNLDFIEGNCDKDALKFLKNLL